MHIHLISEFMLDASVVISILESGYGDIIFGGLGPRMILTKQVIREVFPKRKINDNRREQLERLIRDRHLQQHVMQQDELLTFLDLVSAEHPDGLNDGEASTIASAYHRNTAIVIDEHKALRICKEKFPAVPVYNAIDLLKLAEQQKLLSAAQLQEGLVNALQRARMHVHSWHMEWIAGKVQREVLANCRSIRKGTISKNT